MGIIIIFTNNGAIMVVIVLTIFLYDEQKLTGEEIAEQTGVSRSTVYRVIKEKEN